MLLGYLEAMRTLGTMFSWSLSLLKGSLEDDEEEVDITPRPAPGRCKVNNKGGEGRVR